MLIGPIKATDLGTARAFGPPKGTPQTFPAAWCCQLSKAAAYSVSKQSPRKYLLVMSTGIGIYKTLVRNFPDKVAPLYSVEIDGRSGDAFYVRNDVKPVRKRLLQIAKHAVIAKDRAQKLDRAVERQVDMVKDRSTEFAIALDLPFPVEEVAEVETTRGPRHRFKP